MANATNFFNTHKVDATGATFNKKKDKPKEEQRQDELENLEPEGVTKYSGPKPITNIFKRYIVQLIISSDEDLKQFERYFKEQETYSDKKNKVVLLAEQLGNYNLLKALLNELDAGRIKYDEDEKRIIYQNRSRDSKGVTKMVKREQGSKRSK